jgi:hypothetical protein
VEIPSATVETKDPAKKKAKKKDAKKPKKEK